jgi:PAS domain S-box-containing protein
MNKKSLIENADKFLDNSPVSIHFVNADGMIIWANQKELDVMGYTRDEFIDRPIMSLHTDKLVIFDILNKAADFNGVENYPAQIIHKDKSILYALITANAYKENDEFKHTRSYTSIISKEAYELFRQELVFKSNFKLQD